jgi:hypothetical protein
MGLLALLISLAHLSIALAIGYWCYFTWQLKGRSPWTGFILGFLFTLLLTLLAGLIFVAVSYGLEGRRSRGASW